MGVSSMEKRQAASITALGPNDPDDGEEGRKQRGLAIAALVPDQKQPAGLPGPVPIKQRHLHGSSQ